MIPLLIISLIILLLIYSYSTRNYDYWRKRNIKHDPPLPFVGTHLDNQLYKKSITVISLEIYNRYKDEKLIGYYRGCTPELIVKDLELIRHIMTADFACFHHRGQQKNIKIEPLFRNLFTADGDDWRLVRHRLTPAFTSAKLKAMFPLVVKCAERLQDSLGSGGVKDARETMARFTIEFIGSCGFGIEMNTLSNEKSQYLELGKLIFERSLVSIISAPLWDIFPELRCVLYFQPRKLKDSLTDIVKTIKQQRQNKFSGRNDFIDLLLQLEAKGKLVGESIEKQNPDGSPAYVEKEMDLELQVAQVFVFFAAGFETSSSSTSYTLHELAYNPEIQKRVQKEIDEVMSKYDNKLCYNAISEMSLLDMSFKEGMRKFPPVGALNRVCTRRYKLPGYDVILDPGVKILIPAQAIHMDEQYYDNPEEFRPERFTPEAEKMRPKFSYLPFGAGPRACIGERLGHMQSLAGLAAVLHKFSVVPAPQSTRKIKPHPGSNIVQGVSGGLPLIFQPRKKNES